MKSSSLKQIYATLYGPLEGQVGTFNYGLSIESTRRPLSPSHGRKVHWALAVVKLYLKGQRENFVPQYPDEATYRPARYYVGKKGGISANRNQVSVETGGVSK